MAKCSKQSKFLHIATFPWFAMGHITPYLHLSNELAERGHKISFLLPNKAQLQLQHLNLHPNLITFHPITVPHIDGLPPGTETASDVPYSMSGLLSTAFDLTQDQIEELLRALKPDFVFYDFAYWIPKLATGLGFKTVSYNVVSASTIAYTLYKLPKDRSLALAEVTKPSPGYPSSTVVLRPHEARAWLTYVEYQSGSRIPFIKRVTSARENCNAICIRTCRELEGQMCDYIANHFGRPVLLTGPVLPLSTAKTMPLENRWAKWLDGFNPGSVVYCAFGSQVILAKDQFRELVLGFELTGLPFLVALKPPHGAATVEEALPEGFEERVRGRGLVYGGWIQQPQLLDHPSVGCFVGHCGFGSMWESLLSDNQIVLLPEMSDHILNTRLLAEELKVAVEVERDENGWFTKESLCMAIKCVMDKDSEVGGLVKKNHEKWKETLASPGFMSSYIDEFIQKLYHI